MHLFKKKKNFKVIIEQLCDHLLLLPSTDRVQKLISEASLKAEGGKSKDDTSISRNRKGKGYSRLQAYKTAAPMDICIKSVENELGKSVMLKSDCKIGLDDGLKQEEITALDMVEKKLTELSFSLANTEKQEEISLILKHSLQNDLVSKLLSYHARMSFKSRQLTATYICNILSKGFESLELNQLVSAYVKEHSTYTIEQLCSNYKNGVVYFHTGIIFRAFLKFDCIHNCCLADDMLILKLFMENLLRVKNFEKVSDAFSTFRLILEKKSRLVRTFLGKNYSAFFPLYNSLLQSSEYIAQRQSLKLLSDLLLYKENSEVMLRYISDVNNLVLIMNLMRVKSESMRMEAFHVFKIFVANPDKEAEVTAVLTRNKTKLIAYIAKLSTERESDIFKDEKTLVMRTLESLSLPK